MKDRSYGGIDPGKKGAMAFLDAGGQLLVARPMPLITGKKSKDQFDLDGIFRLLLIYSHEYDLFVTCEELHAMPVHLGGGFANFARGQAILFPALMRGMGICNQPAHPLSWQRVMHAGQPGRDTKQRSIQAAQRLWPTFDFHAPGGRKFLDGLAEAALIAEYGRRQLAPGRGEPISKIA